MVLSIPALQPDLANPGILTRTLGAIFGVAGSAAASVLWIGMMFCALSSVRHSMVAKICWMVLFLTINILAALMYYIVVYNRLPTDSQAETI